MDGFGTHLPDGVQALVKGTDGWERIPTPVSVRIHRILETSLPSVPTTRVRVEDDPFMDGVTYVRVDVLGEITIRLLKAWLVSLRGGRPVPMDRFRELVRSAFGSREAIGAHLRESAWDLMLGWLSSWSAQPDPWDALWIQVGLLLDHLRLQGRLPSWLVPWTALDPLVGALLEVAQGEGPILGERPDPMLMVAAARRGVHVTFLVDEGDPSTLHMVSFLRDELVPSILPRPRLSDDGTMRAVVSIVEAGALRHGDVPLWGLGPAAGRPILLAWSASDPCSYARGSRCGGKVVVPGGRRGRGPEEADGMVVASMEVEAGYLACRLAGALLGWGRSWSDSLEYENHPNTAKE